MTRPRLRHVRGALPLVGCATVMIVLTVGASPALASVPGPGWTINSIAEPTNFSSAHNASCEEEPEGVPSASSPCDSYRVIARNVGSLSSTSEPIVVTDTLPPGLEAVYVRLEEQQAGAFPTSTECTTSPIRCEYLEPVPAGAELIVTVNVKVPQPVFTSVTNSATIEGGGLGQAIATGAPTTEPNTLNGAPSPFALTGFDFRVDGLDGRPDLQAGDHPYGLTTSFNVASSTVFDPSGTTRYQHHPVQQIRDVVVDLPAGFIGDPQSTPHCALTALHENYVTVTGTATTACPAASKIGTITVDGVGIFHTSNVVRGQTSGIFNMVPEAGYPAEFGFSYLGVPVLMYASTLPTQSGYAVRVSVPGLPSLPVQAVSLTFFGNPAVRDGGATSSAAFLTNPLNCASAVPLTAKIEVDSWDEPGRWVSEESTPYPQVTGCDMLQFQPTIEVGPEVSQADTPSGYEVDLKVPQAVKFAPFLATPELKDATVVLPEGVSVSPGAADGLVGCKESGPEGIELGDNNTLGHEVREGEEPGAGGLPRAARGHCPSASRIGTVEIETPLLPARTLRGHVFLAQPRCGGEGQPACTEASARNGELYGLYLEVEGEGVIIKLKGSVSANPITGRLSTTFKENPQLPFSELRLRLNGGARAPLANPQSCGQAVTISDLSPWSAPETPDATPSSSFDVTGCGASTPFGPSFAAGTVTPIGGGFSPFTLTFSRRDGEQDLSGLTVQTPPGLLGMLSKAQLCPEPQASNGTCGPESQIGHTHVAAGAGSHPFWVGGNVYLTGPYKGAPFGLSVVVPAIAGPFNLGNVIVRAAIFVDPHDSHLTVISDALPQIIDGVPLRVQTVNVSIDKASFTFNPTNCSQQQIAATITAAQGASANVASPFAAAGCKNLPFKPSFTVSTSARTSKANGASLVVKLTQKPGEANIHKVDLQLPLALPSRLTTLQKACSEAQFAANPAGCPAGSVIGTATAHTPVLQVPLTGPAYLVSHGGAAFPDVVFLLQGDERGGVIRIDVVGNTDIKKGITYSRFETVPDTPISSFETNLPEGPHSALAAFGNLCTQNLVMPTTLVGQNGAQVKQSTKIGVTGCKAVTISNRKLSGKNVVLTFFLTAKGTVTVTGNGLKRYRKTLSAGSHQIEVALLNAGLSLRRHHRKIKIKVALRSGAKTSSATTTLKL